MVLSLTVLLAHTQVKDTVIKTIGKKIDSLQQRYTEKKVTIDSSLYFPFQVEQKKAPVVKTNLRSKEIINSVKAGKKAVLFVPYDPSKDTVAIKSEIKEIKKSIEIKPENKIVIVPKKDTLPKPVTMINLLKLDSIRSAKAERKITIDSSVYQNRSIVKSSSSKQKNELTINELNYQIDGAKQSVVLVPGIKPKFIGVKEKESAQPIKMKNLLLLDSLYKKSAVKKITVDSSVYQKYVAPKVNSVVKTNLKAKQITGLVLPTNKNKYFVPSIPSLPQKELVVQEPISKPFVIEKVSEPKIKEPKIDNNEVASAVSKKVLDSLNKITYQAKITIDSSALLPKKTLKENRTIVKTDLRAQEIKGTITPKDANRNIVPIAAKPVVTKSIVVSKPLIEARSPLESLDTNLIRSQTEAQAIITRTAKTNFKAQSVTGTLLPDKKGISIVPTQAINDSLSPQNNSLLNSTEMAASDDLPPLTGEIPKTITYKQKSSIPETTLDPSRYYTTPSNKNFSNLDGSLPNDYGNNNNTVVKSDLKSQTVTTGVLLPKAGQPITVQPITIDSIAMLAAASNSNSNAVMVEPPPVNNNTFTNSNPTTGRTKIVNDNSAFQKETNFQKVDLTRNKNAYSAPSYSLSGIKYNFYLSQNGKYAISFYTRDFYLNISQNGQLSDLSVVQSGKVSNASISRVSRVGNLNVNYNEKGQLNAINDVAIDYTYDGKVSKIGDVPITYTYDGLIDKVGDVKLYYNTNGTVYLIDHYKITYNYDGLVNGIDDSKGLIIFKTQIK